MGYTNSMTSRTDRERNQNDARQLQSIRQRESFNNAYAALLGQQNVQSFTAFTFEEALDRTIERIEGEDSELHPNQLKRVARIKDNILRAIEEIRNVDPEEFRLKNEGSDVNTSSGGG